MNDKSYVSIEQHVCLVCGKQFDTGNLLLDKRLKESMHRHTTTGWGLCSEHKALYDQGYVALVEVDPTKMTETSDMLKPEDAYRTGRIIHMRKYLFADLFTNFSNDSSMPLVFIEPDVYEHIETLQKQSI